MKVVIAWCYLISFFVSHAHASNDLRIATYIEPPFTNVVNGEFTGKNIDVARYLAEKANYNPVFIECPFARCMAMIKQGQADMVMAIRKTKAREQILTYLTPPFFIQHVPIRFFTLSGSNIKIDNYQDLAHLTIGSLRGITYFDQFDHDGKLNKVEVSTIGQLINLLKKNRIDTFLEREESIHSWIDYKEYQQIFELAEYEYDKSVGVYIGISKKSKIVKEVKSLSSHLESMVENGIIEKIYRYHDAQIEK